MGKEQIFSQGQVIVQNDKYILKTLCEEDKINYLGLYQENSIVAKSQNYGDYAEFVWKKLREDDAIYVSVFLRDANSYVGNIALRQWSSATPEIGMDVLLKYRRQGIAYETIPLFAKRILGIKSMEYFLVRIYSDNEPSRKLFEKLGAVQIGKEPSEFAEVLEQLKEKSREQYEEFLFYNPDVEEIANRNYIEQYRYLPN